MNFTIKNCSILMIIIIIIQTSPIDCNHQHVDYGDHPTIRFYKVEELNIYNTLVDCVSNWREKFAKCNLEITALADNIFTVINEHSTVGEIIKCCGIWLVRDCWLSHSGHYCTKNQTEIIWQLPFKLVPYLHKWCNVYHDQTIMCLIPRYPYLATLIILTIMIVIFMFITIIFIYINRRRKFGTFQTIDKLNNHTVNNNNKNIKTFEYKKPEDPESGIKPDIDNNDNDERGWRRKNGNH
ncbi:hypothetical protein DERF_006197 [Dermatophagoides farinae]|uniref:Uncharacterized protein n=1 Tax=Dermatophagoides farinae TaxID=6954 RepID=A0A922I8J2_DERFA|nr:hypothetical protein DERF_006197 [Dermatophagoides farinae]